MAQQRKPRLGLVGLLILLAVVGYYRIYKPGQSPQHRDSHPAEYGQPAPPAPEKIKKKKQVRALKTFTGKVIAIKDGDTFEVLLDGQPERVRLAEIDCPEKAQPFGMKARQYASDLCFGKTVTVSAGGKRDRYGRVVGTVVTADGINVNEALVMAGYAWHYKDYSDNAQLGVLEDQAHAKGLGLWADKSPQAPWEYRKRRRKQAD